MVSLIVGKDLASCRKKWENLRVSLVRAMRTNEQYIHRAVLAFLEVEVGPPPPVELEVPDEVFEECEEPDGAFGDAVGRQSSDDHFHDDEEDNFHSSDDNDDSQTDSGFDSDEEEREKFDVDEFFVDFGMGKTTVLSMFPSRRQQKSNFNNDSRLSNT